MAKKFRLPTGKYKNEFFKQFSNKIKDNEEEIVNLDNEKNIEVKNQIDTKEITKPIVITNTEPNTDGMYSDGCDLFLNKVEKANIIKDESDKPLENNINLIEKPIETKEINGGTIEAKENEDKINTITSINQKENIDTLIDEVEKINTIVNDPPIIKEKEKFQFNSKNIQINQWKTKASLIPPKITKNQRFEIIKKDLEEGSLAYKINKSFLESMNMDLINNINLTFLIEHKEEEDILWKSDSPIEFFNLNRLNNEILLSKYDDSGLLIKKNILINGLSLGILPNLLNLRNDIDNILIIEEQEEIIDLIKPHLDKSIKIVNGDFLTYIKMLSENEILLKGYFPNKKIDYILIDNWANSLNQKRKEVLFLSIREFIRRYLPTTLYHVLNHDDYLENYNKV